MSSERREPHADELHGRDEREQHAGGDPDARGHRRRAAPAADCRRRTRCRPRAARSPRSRGAGRTPRPCPPIIAAGVVAVKRKVSAEGRCAGGERHARHDHILAPHRVYFGAAASAFSSFSASRYIASSCACHAALGATLSGAWPEVSMYVAVHLALHRLDEPVLEHLQPILGRALQGDEAAHRGVVGVDAELLRRGHVGQDLQPLAR